MKGDFGAACAVRFMHFDHSPFDLAVVAIDAGLLQRVPDPFLGVVKVTPPIGWKQMQLDFERHQKRLRNPAREERTDRGAVLAAFAAEERAVAHVPVIPVDARRERQRKSEHGYRLTGPVRKGHSDVPRTQIHRFQGGTLVVGGEDGAEAAAGADTGCAALRPR